MMGRRGKWQYGSFGLTYEEISPVISSASLLIYHENGVQRLPFSLAHEMKQMEQTHSITETCSQNPGHPATPQAHELEKMLVAVSD